jgi:predicted metal-dependent hydrolase
MMSKPEIIQTEAGLAKLLRTARKTLAISVHPDGSLELVAPMDATEEKIAAMVIRRNRWIADQRRNFHAMNATRPGPKYVTGATHRYLGRQYRLKVGVGDCPGVLLKGAFFHVTTQNGEPAEVTELLNTWFREKAKEQFAKRIDAWASWCKKHRLPEPRLRILKMLKRWGSAGHDGKILLNPELIHAPSRCIDYVVAHEICHLRHPHHSPQFFRLLSSLMPDWRCVKERLERAEL